ncbi:MAG: threonine--tRNA ligase [Chloroflexi bacterium]|nr:threonine--tRNA ligase [Chloroflexota bacterium]
MSHQEGHASDTGHDGALEGRYAGEDDTLIRMRHSAAHMMAEAVLSMFPEAKLGIGPPIEDGFYYDFLLPRTLSTDDLPEIEARMRESAASAASFVASELPREEGLTRFADQPFKVEIIESLTDETVSTYTHRDFTDLCQGPHAESTNKTGAFTLTRVAGAYWRGNENNPQLQRIYGALFETQEELDAHLERLAEAERRDHRRLGRELDLFFFDPIAPASPFFLPKGATVYNLMVDFIRELYDKYGYQEVITPQIFLTDLWKQSGHYDNYLENMYLTQSDEIEYGVKPMNCPGHCVVYQSQLHSYRALPLRLADFGRLHRNERSGVTHGLTRVRSFSQDDAHIFCRLDQVQDEFSSLIRMMRDVYEAFGLNEPRYTLSLRPEKRVGSDETWDRAEEALREALTLAGADFEEIPNEGAFYGPKIDLFSQDALRREWQLSTFQLDFNLPERFDLEYVTEDNTRERPVMIHRAILGSLERFFGVLLEHNAGAFPVWLAPVQATVIPIADRHIPYAQQVQEQLHAAGLRCEIDDRNERMNAKIREAQTRHVPYMLVVGDREAESGAVAVRRRENSENLGAAPISEFVERVLGEVAAVRG